MAFFAPIDETDQIDLYAPLEDEAFVDFPPLPYEVPEEWTGLCREMEALNKEYSETCRGLFSATRKLRETYETIEKLRKNIEVFGSSTTLKEMYTDLLDKFEVESNIADQVEEVRRALGKREAMRRLFKKEPDKKLCPVCCDEEIACFIDPCGHTFCQQCITRHDRPNAAHMKCPVCRTVTKQVRQLFFS